MNTHHEHQHTDQHGEPDGQHDALPHGQHEGHEKHDALPHGQHEGHGKHDAVPHDQHEGHGKPGVASTASTHGSHGHEEEGAVKSPGQHDGGHKAHADHTGHEEMFRRRFWVCLALSIPVLLYSPFLQEMLGFTMPAFPGSSAIGPLFSVIVFLYGGVPFLQLAVPELRNRQPGMMTLISLAIIVALFYSLATLWLPGQMPFFWELVTLIVIMLLGHWLEMRSIRQASGALNELAKLLPDTAERLGPDGAPETVPAASLRVGDMVLVRPGSSVPADGRVEEGESHVSEAMVTGESQPVGKGPGDRVIAGTLNTDGSLRVMITATGDETALAGIMRLVQQAQESKSPTQLLADRAAGWLFYVALAVAGLTAVAWTIAVGFSVDIVARVATVLVIACPHALGLAIPLVVAITTSLGARHGILIRDRLAMEGARTLDAVIFDKTGTLTRGQFGVVGMEVAPGWEEDKALALAAAIEGDSEHTIARGIREAAQERGVEAEVVTEFEALKGRGVRATWSGEPVYVGGPRLLEMLGLSLPAALLQFEEQASGRGQSVVTLVVDNQPVATLALADVIRPESKLAVQRLREMGLEVAMLTGDSQAVAASVAAELGIDTFFAEVLPEHKDRTVAEMQASGKRVAMVGDGVNDAPALTRADLGVAIGSGTDVAVESADVILVQSNPLDMVKIVQLSRASYRKMVENLVWATGYNLVALPLAAGVLAPWGIVLSPAVGAFLMSASTIVVAINAQFMRATRLGE